MMKSQQVEKDAGNLQYEDAMIFNRQEFLKRIGGDESLIPFLYQEFKKSYEEEYRKLIDAIDRNDAQAIGFISHSIKGMLGNISAEKASKAALAMELAGKNDQLDNIQQLLDNLKEAYEAFEKAISQEG